ncbi:MAG: Sec-independent protein translocase protein TatB [Pseudomonadota bacterium]
MFFDVGFSELFLLAVVGLLILGPERLPAVVKTLGGWVRRGRQMAAEFQRELEKEVDLKELKQLKQDVEQPLREAASTLDEGHSILEQTRDDVAKLGAPIAASSSIDDEGVTTGSVPEHDTIEPHAPMPSTEDSDMDTDEEGIASMRPDSTDIPAHDSMATQRVEAQGAASSRSRESAKTDVKSDEL